MLAPDLAALAVPVASLTLLPGNPRRGDVDAIVRSLARFGQRKPIVAKRDGTVVAGNHTLQAVQQLGWDEIAVVWVDDDEATAQAFALADNRTAELGGYDEAALLELIEQVGGVDPELLADTGWLPDAVAALEASLVEGAPPEALTDPDEVPEPPAEPVTKPGDLWLLGPHRVLCSDATTVDALDRLLVGERPGAVFTDPPYGMNLDTEDAYRAMHGSVGHESRSYAPVIGDDAPFDAGPLVELLKDVAEQFWWGADYYRTTIQDGGSWLVWDKRDNDQGMNLDAVHGAAFELCWSRQPHKREIARVLWSGHHGMQGEDTKRRVHPTQKPVALALWFFERWVKPEALVLDLFAGSGSTLIACHQTGRRAALCELDPGYCDVILARYAAHTGITPTLEGTGEAYDFTQETDAEPAEAG